MPCCRILKALTHTGRLASRWILADVRPPRRHMAGVQCEVLPNREPKETRRFIHLRQVLILPLTCFLGRGVASRLLRSWRTARMSALEGRLPAS